jgi:L-alanine-DL-glutamate epimerase-like enolase superfamily enzyme
MRIERIELRHTKMELVSLFETSLGVELFEERIIVRVDRDGVTGWGEWVVEPIPSYSYETLQTAFCSTYMVHLVALKGTFCTHYSCSWSPSYSYHKSTIKTLVFKRLWIL